MQTKDLIYIGGGMSVYKGTVCESCGAGAHSLKHYKGWLGFEALECKLCGHQEPLIG